MKNWLERWRGCRVRKSDKFLLRGQPLCNVKESALCVDICTITCFKNVPAKRILHNVFRKVAILAECQLELNNNKSTKSLRPQKYRRTFCSFCNNSIYSILMKRTFFYIQPLAAYFKAIKPEISYEFVAFSSEVNCFTKDQLRCHQKHLK